MQGAELLFATAIGVAFLHEAWPRGIAVWGAVLVVLGHVAFAILVGRRSAGSLPRTRALRTDRGEGRRTTCTSRNPQKARRWRCCTAGRCPAGCARCWPSACATEAHRKTGRPSCRQRG